MARFVNQRVPARCTQEDIYPIRRIDTILAVWESIPPWHLSSYIVAVVGVMMQVLWCNDGFRMRRLLMHSG